MFFPVDLSPYVIGVHGFSFSIMFKYDVSAKLLEITSFLMLTWMLHPLGLWLVNSQTWQFQIAYILLHIKRRACVRACWKKEEFCPRKIAKNWKINRESNTHKQQSVLSKILLDLRFKMCCSDIKNNCFKALPGHWKMSLTNWQCGLTIKKIKVWLFSYCFLFVSLFAPFIAEPIRYIWLFGGIDLSYILKFYISRRKENSQKVGLFSPAVNLFKKKLRNVPV